LQELASPPTIEYLDRAGLSKSAEPLRGQCCTTNDDRRRARRA